MEFGLNIAYDPENIAQFNRALATYVKELGMEQNKVIRQWSGNLAVNLMMETPPFTKNRSASNGFDARDRGVASIEGNLNRAVTTPESFFGKTIRNDKLRKILRQKDRKRLEGFLKGIGNENWKVVDFNKELHTKERPLIYRKIKHHKLLTMNIRSWKDYLKRLEKRVGWMKAGWAVSALELGQKVPNWIANNVPFARGRLTQTEQQGTLTIAMENSSPTIARYSSRFNYGIQVLFGRMEKDIAVRLDYIARKKGGKL